MYSDNTNELYKYVHIKMKKLKNIPLPRAYIKESNINIIDANLQISDKVKYMLQIINVSDKMLYNEAKAEKSLLT